MSQKHQKQSYQPLPTAAAMDNPAMSQSSSSGGSSRGGSREDIANLAPMGLPATHSSQQLMHSDSDSMEERHHLRPNPSGDPILPHPAVPLHLGAVRASEWFAVSVLCFVNLINYMDRFTIAGKCSNWNGLLAILLNAPLSDSSWEDRLALYVC